MTPELKAAAARLSTYWEIGKLLDVQIVGPDSDGFAAYVRDLELLAHLALAEHPADDDEPVTLEELRAAAQTCDVQLIVFDDGTVEVYGTVKPETRGQLRALLKGLGR